ncbi:hypothetical protein DMC30DRAFT_256606 [Rhodotorula diobovata]|uniref:Uncharacterized protein n=1 Tax=Rhodotorula diobovata TaxID=5288 RepID=A0A5C5FTX0_9BASI|nr:hypothetical protein DMC30DRAFT_256606 [Rhodotorula diobovata]
MLGRSHSTRFDHNQENPHAHHPLHHKTPARAGKSSNAPGPAPVTGGKGALLQQQQQQTAKSGRVLGAKDRNGGKAGHQQDPSAVLFPGKPGASTSQAQAGPSCAPRPAQQQQQQQFKTPLPNKTLRPAQDMRTPVTGIRPTHAPALMLGSPDVSMDAEVEEDHQEPQEVEDREVEYAGPSARDYDEPYIPDYPEPDYKSAGFGAALKSMPLVAMEDPADWGREDELERASFQARLDDNVPEHADLLAAAAPQPLFPAPKRRAPLSAKPANTSSLASSTSGRARVPSSLAGSSAAGSARKPLVGSSGTAARRAVAPASASATPGSARLTGGASRAPARGGMQPPSRLGLTSSKPGLTTATKAGPSTSATSRPLAARPPSTSSLSSAGTRPRPPPLSLPLSRPGSSSSLRSAASTTAPLSPAQVAAQRKAEEQAAERELGIFGVVDGEGEGGDDLAQLIEGEAGAFSFGDEASFSLDLDL